MTQRWETTLEKIGMLLVPRDPWKKAPPDHIGELGRFRNLRGLTLLFDSHGPRCMPSRYIDATLLGCASVSF